jgi:lipoyl(octanoyl) transferase
LIDSIAEFGVKGERVDGRSGVWVALNGDFVKVAAIGIRVADATTMHGFALNCNNSLQPYETIIACGIKDAATSTLSELTGTNITTALAAEVVMRHLKEISKVEL